MAGDHEPIGLDEAYSLETPADSRKLYARWASTYDSDFIEPTGYVYHHNVVRLFVEAGGSVNGQTLDVGCGTGVVGVALAALGPTAIDGVDISAEMLAVARSKHLPSGGPVYRQLFEADLTRGIDVGAKTYGGIISVGTFTHGHLGPEPIDELIRVAAPGALLAVGIHSDHFVSEGFADWLADRVDEGLITTPHIEPVTIYSRSIGEHAGAMSNATLFRTAT